MQIKNDVVPSGAASFCYERLVIVYGLSCKYTHIVIIKKLRIEFNPQLLFCIYV